MILEGPVAVYDRVSINNFVITRSTEINYPEKYQWFGIMSSMILKWY